MVFPDQFQKIPVQLRFRTGVYINFNIFPVKVDKFEYINIVPNEVRTNYNIDVSNIALNQSDYMKQVKGGENDFDYLISTVGGVIISILTKI